MNQISSALNPHLPGREIGLSREIGGPTADGTSIAAAANPAGLPGDTIVEGPDVAGNAAGAGAMGVGEYFLGTLGTNSDTDWIGVDLVAGQTYTFAVAGTGALGLSNDDPAMSVYAPGGGFLQYDDESGPGHYAEITLTAAVSGLHHIAVQSWNNTDSGTYGVSVTQGDKASFHGEMIAGTLLGPDQAWTATPGTGATVTWAIRATGENPTGAAPSGFDPVSGSPFIPPNASQIAVIEGAMAYLDGISGLNLVQVAPGAASNSATILFGAYDNPFDGAGAYAYFPTTQPGGNTSAASNAGDVWMNNDSYNSNTYAFGGFNAFATLHEIGHAIGLAHPGDYNAGPGVPITYSADAQFIEDTHQYTVMSYFDEANTGASAGFDYPDTFMLYDFMAIHQLYGADASYNAGDTIYGFNASDAGSVYDFTVNTTPFMTVYDGAGTDTIDLSGYGMAQMLTLEEGAFSNIGGAVGRFSIAYGAVVENAIGGSGNDTISGNDAGNSLDGGAGADVISGGLGHDALMGAAGRDSLDGGMGNDTLIGGADRDRLSGGNGDDFLSGGLGHDLLVGGRGDDTLNGGNRNDRLVGAADSDVLYGGKGNDILRGGTQNDRLDGGADNDFITGGAGFDTIIGGAGDDTLVGAFNADRFIFSDNHGSDVIEDFEATNKPEKLDFSGLSTLNSVADVLGTGSGSAAATQIGNDVEINTGSGLVLLKNVLYADLDVDDFVF